MYTSQEYYGCCGAAIIFFGNTQAVDPELLERTVAHLERNGYGMLTCTLIPRQSGHKVLVDAGFKIVARTMGRTNNLIRTYIKECKPAPKQAAPRTTTDAPRAFGAHQ